VTHAAIIVEIKRSEKRRWQAQRHLDLTAGERSRE
jgi:hypothetical protein